MREFLQWGMIVVTTYEILFVYSSAHKYTIEPILSSSNISYTEIDYSRVATPNECGHIVVAFVVWQ